MGAALVFVAAFLAVATLIVLTVLRGVMKHEAWLEKKELELKYKKRKK